MATYGGVALRPGRSTEKLKTDRPRATGLGAPGRGPGGFRAAGLVTEAPAPVLPETPQAAQAATEATGAGALSQFQAAPLAPELPKAPGLAKQIGLAAGTRIATDLAGAGVSQAAEAAGDFLSGLPSRIEAWQRPYMTADIPTAAQEFTGQVALPAIPQGPSWDVSTADYSIPAESAFGTPAEWEPGSGGQWFAGGDGGGMTFEAAPAAPSGGGDWGGCFITEATMAALGSMDDEAQPLQVLRWFRDNVMARTPQGQALIGQYYRIAPMVVEALEGRQDSDQVFGSIYQRFIAPAVAAIQGGDYARALSTYAAMLQAVMPYAQQSAQMMMGEMGQMAGAVAQAPQAAMSEVQMPSSQMGPGALSQFRAQMPMRNQYEDDSFQTPVRFGRS